MAGCSCILAHSMLPASLPGIAPFDLGTLERERASVCAVSDDLRIRYVNRAWRTFARDNGARGDEERWGVGANLLEATPEVLRRFYVLLFDRARDEGTVLRHEYECSSPEVERRFVMHVYPCQERALVLVHTLSREVPHPQSGPGVTAIDALYRTRDGLLAQCSHCRRFKRKESAARWEWVPAMVADPPRRISHGLCRPCAQYYYPDVDDG